MVRPIAPISFMFFLHSDVSFDYGIKLQVPVEMPAETHRTFYVFFTCRARLLMACGPRMLSFEQDGQERERLDRPPEGASNTQTIQRQRLATFVRRGHERC
jgi:hypothetical protein